MNSFPWRFQKRPQKAGDFLSLILKGGCLFCFAASLTACAVVGKMKQSPFQAGPVELEIGNVVDTASGQVISFDELLGKLSEASIVYVGETHTSVEDHKIQLKVLRGLAEKGGCVEMGMEMFPRTVQPVLDRYVHGELNEEEFLKEVGWEQVWGFPYGLYRGLIDFAKERRLRITALNAPHKIVRRIAQEGLSSLAPDEREQVAREFHLDDPRNRERIRKDFNAHLKNGIKDFETFFQAQLSWEETMAETLAERLNKTGGNCRIVVIVGKGHMTDRHGIPYLTALRAPHTHKTVVPIPIDYPYSSLDPNLGDYVVITDRSEPFPRPRLGVSIQPAATGRGAEIISVVPESPAAKANLRKGDIILSIDGTKVNSVGEVQRALAEGGPGYKVLIERRENRMTIDVTIPR